MSAFVPINHASAQFDASVLIGCKTCSSVCMVSQSTPIRGCHASLWHCLLVSKPGFSYKDGVGSGACDPPTQDETHPPKMRPTSPLVISILEGAVQKLLNAKLQVLSRVRHPTPTYALHGGAARRATNCTASPVALLFHFALSALGGIHIMRVPTWPLACAYCLLVPWPPWKPPETAAAALTSRFATNFCPSHSSHAPAGLCQGHRSLPHSHKTFCMVPAYMHRE